MGIENIGPWLLLVIGLGMLGAAGLAVYRGKPPKYPWIYLFGLASAGCGVWGPGFLDFYAKMAPLLNMQQAANEESYSEVFAKIGDGSLSNEYQELAVAYALDRPIVNMDKLLDGAIKAAPDPGGKAMLEQARKELRGKKLAAETLSATITKPAQVGGTPRPNKVNDIAKFDSTTRMLISEPLLRKPPAEFSPKDREQLRKFSATRKSRAGRN